MKFAHLITAATLFITAGSALAQQPISAKLNRQQLDGLLAYPDQVLIVDVRRPDEITTIGGFPAYLSVQAKDIDSGAVFIPRDRTLITVSNHAGRALKAAELPESADLYPDPNDRKTVKAVKKQATAAPARALCLLPSPAS